MKKIFVYLLLVLNFDTFSQQKLQYFDRKMIVEHKIKEIRERVSTEKRKTKDWILTLNNYYIFDKSANILSFGEGRVATGINFIYNNENKVVDYYWKEKGSHKIGLLFSKVSTPKEFQKNLKEINDVLASMLFQKDSFSHNSTFDISDSCPWINAEYKISVIKETNGLPSILKGNFIKELDVIPNPKKLASPKQMYIYYDYEFY